MVGLLNIVPPFMLFDGCRWRSTRLTARPFVAWAADAVHISGSNSPYVVTLSRGIAGTLGFFLTGSSSSSSSDEDKQRTLEVVRSELANMLLLLLLLFLDADDLFSVE